MDPVTVRGRASKARIVEAAARLMHVNGVAATSVDEVLAESGAGKSQFYHYFRTKDELIEAVLEYRVGLGEAEQAGILASTPGWQGIRAWLDAVVEGQRRARYVGGCPIGSLAAELADRDAGLRTRLGNAFRRKAAALADRLRELRARGELAPDADPDALALFTIATLQGALLLASTLKREDVLVRAVDEAWAHLSALRRRENAPARKERD